MTKFAILALSATALALPTAAQAQDEAPKAEVFVGPSVGYHDLGVDLSVIGLDEDGGIIYGGVIGVDVPVGEKVFVGIEGNFHLGSELIDSEYGVSARAGIRLDGGAKLYVRGGYQEVDFDFGVFNAPAITAGLDDSDGDYLVGAGAEFPLGDGPIALRVNLDTVSFDTTRATAGVLFSF